MTPTPVLASFRAPARRVNRRAIASFVMGIASVVPVLGPGCAVGALIAGLSGLVEMHKSREWGRTLAVIGIAVTLLVTIWWALVGVPHILHALHDVQVQDQNCDGPFSAADPQCGG